MEINTSRDDLNECESDFEHNSVSMAVERVRLLILYMLGRGEKNIWNFEILILFTSSFLFYMQWMPNASVKWMSRAIASSMKIQNRRVSAARDRQPYMPPEKGIELWVKSDDLFFFNEHCPHSYEVDYLILLCVVAEGRRPLSRV